MKYINDEQNLSSYHIQSISGTSAAIRSQQNVAPRRFNKDSRPRFLDKIESGNVVLRNMIKSPIPTHLRSPQERDTVQSAADITSLNT